jgi:hypothetical protein
VVGDSFIFPEESADPQVLARNYMRSTLALLGMAESDDASDAASFQVGNLVLMGHPEDAWPILLLVIEMTDDERVLDLLGAGDLENVVRDHGPAFIDRIETAARQSWRMRRALQGVWASDSPVWPRIEAIIGHTP